MIANPFAFGAAGYPMSGAEEYLYRLMLGCYMKAGKVVPGTTDQLIQAALARDDCHYTERELTKAVQSIQSGQNGKPGCAPLITTDDKGVITPTEHFGLRN